MLDTMMKVSLTLVAFDKMSRVIRDAVNKSNDEFDKLQREIKNTSDILDKLGQNMTKVGGALTLAGGGLAYKLGITEAIPEAFQMEHRLRELGNVGQLSAKQLEEVRKKLQNNDSSNVGLSNINNRLKLIYGPEYGISIDAEYGLGTIVTITMPHRSMQC